MKSHLKPGLYIVSTPIGNLEDITLRAVNILKSADVILCEDTRVTAKLLAYFSIQTKLIVYNDYSDDFLRNKILALLDEEKIVALVSDAGTPLISDPGYKLVARLQEEGYYVDIAPGATSVIAALTLSALPTDRFAFFGFLPRTTMTKERIFIEVQNLKSTIIFFESAERLVDSLDAAKKVLGDREAAVVREITKLFQEAKRGKLSELIAYYSQTKPRGEIVFLLSGKNSPEEYLSEEEINDKLMLLLKTHSSKDSTEILFKEISEKTDLKKKDIYKISVNLKAQK
jgi:16S rRNA (cytidine1402-2'-O)-methyltransferase